jgi:hypothetical protein
MSGTEGSASSTGTGADQGKDDKYAILAVIVAVVVVALGFMYSKMVSKPKTAGALFKDTEMTSTLSAPGAAGLLGNARIIDLNEHPESDAYKKEKEKIVSTSQGGSSRTISELDNRHLKKLLMRRAIQFLPFAIESQEEFPKIDKQYKSGMYAESEYKKAKQMFDWMNKESEEICEEAEELLPGWGERAEGRPARILGEAHQIYMKLVEKAQQQTSNNNNNNSSSSSNSNNNNNNNNNNSSSSSSSNGGDDDDRADDIIVG